MALIVEDGTGLPTAESYLSVADTSARLAALGLTKFSTLASDPLKEGACRISTKRLDTAFRANPRGGKSSEAQALEFPRDMTFASGRRAEFGSIPEEVLDAQALLAEVRAYEMDASASTSVGSSALSVTLAKGVKVEKGPGVIFTRAEEQARTMAREALDAILWQAGP